MILLRECLLQQEVLVVQHILAVAVLDDDPERLHVPVVFVLRHRHIATEPLELCAESLACDVTLPAS